MSASIFLFKLTSNLAFSVTAFRAKTNSVCLSSICFFSLLLKILEFKGVFVHQIFKVENNIGNSIVVSKVYFINSLVAEINI